MKTAKRRLTRYDSKLVQCPGQRGTSKIKVSNYNQINVTSALLNYLADISATWQLPPHTAENATGHS